MAENMTVSAKLDKLIDKMNEFDTKLSSLEAKVDNRLTVVEQKCTVLEQKSLKHDMKNKYVLKEITKLKSTVNTLEQQKLEKNIIVRGVLELENGDEELLGEMVDAILSSIDPDFVSVSVVSVRRIGVKKGDTPRSILIVMRNTNEKLSIMKNLKGKRPQCAQFKNRGVPWGTSDQKIYLEDHLTYTNGNIFYHSRLLRKNGIVKFAWTKLGHVYVKKDNASYAVNIKTIEQFTSIKKELESTMEQSEEETEAEPMETETDCDTDAAPNCQSRDSKRNNKHLSPKVTRSKKKK